MCLHIGESPEQLKADADIICYKVLYNNKAVIFQTIFEQKGFLTPYKNTKVVIGRAYKSEFSFSMSGKGVEKALHSFAGIESARVDVNFFNGFSTYKGKMCICRCIIPKGSRYYEGTYDGQACYASNKIKYLEVIE